MRSVTRSHISLIINTTESLANIATLSFSLEFLHKYFRERVDASHKCTIAARNQSTNILTPNIVVDNFVLICKPTKPLHILAFFWTGPRRVLRLKVLQSAWCRTLSRVKKKQSTEPKFARMMALQTGKKCQKRFWISSIQLRVGAKSPTRLTILIAMLIGSRLEYSGTRYQVNEFSHGRFEDMHKDNSEMAVRYLTHKRKINLINAAKRRFGSTWPYPMTSRMCEVSWGQFGQSLRGISLILVKRDYLRISELDFNNDK